MVRLGLYSPALLPQLQNRLWVERQWMWSYFTGQRSSRLVTEAPRFGK
jgi:NADH:ubiquinone reductase (H+-translocating)